MITATLESNRHVLKVKYTGKIDSSDLERHYQEVLALMPNLHTGFTLITDLSETPHIDRGCTKILGKVMDGYRKCGVGKIIRIIPAPGCDIGFNILSIFHYDPNIPIQICTNSVEADAMI